MNVTRKEKHIESEDHISIEEKERAESRPQEQGNGDIQGAGEESEKEIKIVYSEPESYFPKKMRKAFKIGEYAENSQIKNRNKAERINRKRKNGGKK